MSHWSVWRALRRAAILSAVVLVSGPVMAQETGHGDLFGDLVHIKRSPDTGQPILQKRWIEYPVTGEDWGYCPIPIDASGAEIPFLDLSCDAAEPDRVVEVDYFGRLSGGRTKESSIRMHFDEVISNIIDAEVLALDPAGRLKFGTGCTPEGVCATWKVIDSPQENLALYHRLMKYGHLQTDPLEVDDSFHGDPALGTVYHPALRAEDWEKFAGVLASLLPFASADACFGGEFPAVCAAPQALNAEDFVRAASFLAGAADKTGRMTVDLIQYMNRILKITVETPDSAAAVSTLPALIRDEDGDIAAADPGLPAPADELFVNFLAAAYFRDERFAQPTPALVSAGTGLWAENPAVPLLPFLLHVNGPAVHATNVDAFVKNASDGQRAVEFIHNYAIPADLYSIYAAPTTTTVESLTAQSSIVDQTLTLAATIASASIVNSGTVTFTVKAAGGWTVGVPVVSGTVTNGAASASYVLPGGTPPQVLQIVADYSGVQGAIAASSGTGTLTLTPPEAPLLSVSNASTFEDTGGLTFELTLSTATTVPVRVQFTSVDFTAVAPADYETVSGLALIDSGLTKAWITVPIVMDTTAEPNETLSLSLSGPLNAVLVRATATGEILDDDGGRAPLLDANRDGSADIFWRHAADGRNAVWNMSGTTQLSGTLIEPAVPDLDWEIRAVGDFSGDWKPDLIWQHRVTGALAAWFMDRHVRIGTRDLTTVTGGTTEPVLDWKIVGAADMDRDGQLDLVWQNGATGELRIWHMAGTVQIDSVPITLDVAGTGWRVVGIDDLNRDGWADLVWREQALGGVAAWLMADARLLAAEWLTPDTVADTAWHLVGVRDLNLDRKPDLLWQHGGTGNLAAWLMNGLVVSSTTDLTPPSVADLDWTIVGLR